VIVLVAAFFSGALFAVGLAVGGMTQPAKIVGFLDLFGHWDASLAFVMGGAILAYMPLHHIIVRRRTPMFATRFLLPNRQDLDWRLLGGSAVFGVGWGLGGFCPGPGLTAVGSLMPQALVFSVAMVAGFVLHRLLDEALSRRSRSRAGTGASSDVGAA
jgi:uncharacterized protein